MHFKDHCRRTFQIQSSVLDTKFWSVLEECFIIIIIIIIIIFGNIISLTINIFFSFVYLKECVNFGSFLCNLYLEHIWIEVNIWTPVCLFLLRNCCLVRKSSIRNSIWSIQTVGFIFIFQFLIFIFWDRKQPPHDLLSCVFYENFFVTYSSPLIVNSALLEHWSYDSLMFWSIFSLKLKLINKQLFS